MTLVYNHHTCTQAAGGIGGRLVEHFYNLGCRVVCVDNDRESLDALKNKLLGNINSVFVNPERFRFFYVDVSCAADVSSMVAEIKREWHCVDILINNAGIMNHGKLLLELSNDEIMNIFNVNILAQMRLCKELLPSMIENKRGHIVNVASSCGLMGAYKLTDYCATKFAVVGFSEALRVELKTICDAHKLTVTTVCPFHVKTKMFDGVEFTRLKWLNLSMEIEYVVKHIVDGILMNKELILIPSLFTHLLIIIRRFVQSF